MRQAHKDAMKLRRRNIALTVAYDGTNYNGFQWQSPPRIAVQNVLEERPAGISATRLDWSAAFVTILLVAAIGGLSV